MSRDYEEQMAFEREARRVAEAVWHLPPGGCQPEHYSGIKGLTELDGIARLRDVTHLIMVTVSRKLEKAESDVRKLNAAEKVERNRAPTVAKWLITKFQLDAQHVRHARENGVTVLTLEQFKDRFFDGRGYLMRRRPAAFGSARNLADGSITIPDDEYVALPIVLSRDRNQKPALNQSLLTISDLAARLSAGEIIVVVAPFGAGKSLTTREIF